MTIAVHAEVEKALRRLRNMGLKVSLTPVGENTALIFITLQSVLNLIKKQIKYPNVEVRYEEPFIVIKVWKT